MLFIGLSMRVSSFIWIIMFVCSHNVSEFVFECSTLFVKCLFFVCFDFFCYLVFECHTIVEMNVITDAFVDCYTADFTFDIGYFVVFCVFFLFVLAFNIPFLLFFPFIHGF